MEAIHLGNTHNGYRLELIQSGKIVESRDVLFNESAVSPDLPYDAYLDPEGTPDSDYEESTDPAPEAQSAPSPDARPVRRARTVGEQNRRALSLPLIKNSIYARAPSEWTVPTSLKQALTQPEWIASIMDELKSIHDHDCYDFIYQLPPGRRAIDSKMIFSIKSDANGTPTRAKSRLVAQGFGQVPGVDYTATYSPVAGSNTLRLLLALSALFNSSIRHYDVKTAFFNGIMDTDLYVKLPKELLALVGEIDSRLQRNAIIDNLVFLHLKKGLYGTKQARINELLRN
jgi:hypothetical protein